MRSITCSSCAKEVKLQQAYSVFGQVLCEPCANERLKKEKKVAKGAVQALVDPTICARCAKDGGTAEFPDVAGFRLCAECENQARNYRVPGWVKSFFAAIVICLLASFFMNIRFVKGYFLWRSIHWRTDTVETMAKKAQAAYACVPDSAIVRAYNDYFQGLLAAYGNNYPEAIARLSACRGKLPPQLGVDAYINDLRVAQAYESKDYALFLKLAEQEYKKAPRDAQVVMQLASAHACNYALSGDEQEKARASALITEALSLPGNEDQDALNDYKRRVLYRLETRQIISTEEYHKRFPESAAAPAEVK